MFYRVTEVPFLLILNTGGVPLVTDYIWSEEIAKNHLPVIHMFEKAELKEVPQFLDTVRVIFRGLCTRVFLEH